MSPAKSTEEIFIREMILEDIPNIFAIGERIFTADKWSALYRTWDEYEPVERFLADGDYCLVAEAEPGNIVGFILGTVIEKRRSAWSYGYVLWLGVDPAYKRARVGSKLLRSLTSRFRKAGVRMVIADTAAENEGAIGFFSRSGFAVESEHVYLAKNLAPRRSSASNAKKRKRSTP